MKTAEHIARMKGKEKIAVLTAYDCPFARLMDGVVDAILVGDSLGMVVLGFKNTKVQFSLLVFKFSFLFSSITV